MTLATGRKSAIIIQRLQTEVATLRESLAAVSAVDVNMLGKKLRSANHDIARMRELNSELWERVSSLEESLFKAAKSSKAQSIHAKLMSKVNHSRGGGTGTSGGSNRTVHDTIEDAVLSRSVDHKCALPIKTSKTIKVEKDCDLVCNSDSDDVLFCDTNDDEKNTTVDGTSDNTSVTVSTSPNIMTLKSPTVASAVTAKFSSGMNRRSLCEVLNFFDTLDSVYLNENQRQAIAQCEGLLKGEAKGIDKSRYPVPSVGIQNGGVVGVGVGVGTSSRKSVIHVPLGISVNRSASEEICSDPESEHPSCPAFSSPTIASVSNGLSASPRIRRVACGSCFFVFICSIAAVMLGAVTLMAIGVDLAAFSILSDG